jgi:3-oxoacyl-[acyl-carrier-protein] synthase II
MGANGNGKRRVVVTGVGMVSSLGSDAETSWSNLIAGQSGVGEITQFDHTDYPVHFAAELKDFQPTDWVDHKSSRRMDRYTQMILAAARQAEADSGIDIAADPLRIGASVATGIGGLRSFQDCYDVLLHRGPDRISPFSIPCIIPNMGAGWVSIELGTKGPLMSQCTACAASNMAIGDALDEIRLGRVDAMIAGGSEAPITRVGVAGFDAMRALSRRNDDPLRASRPFDGDRDGLVMGEAAGIVVLEELERAKARGAKIYAELIGYGMSADAAHITEPDPTGQSPARAMRAAIADAGIDVTEVGYVNAHATSTPVGDTAETKVIKVALGEEHARRTPVSSTKGATGHCFGAAGAIEAIFTIMALRDRIVPPTLNQEEPDPECDLDYVPNVAREVPDLSIAVSNSFGFGGHNATIVLRRPDFDSRPESQN